MTRLGLPVVGSLVVVASSFVALAACSSTPSRATFADNDDAGTTEPAGNANDASTVNDPGSPQPSLGDVDSGAVVSEAGTTVVTTTIYANTDDSLYSMDPKTKSTKRIGAFVGMGGGTNDATVTDVAVNAAGEVYANTESVVYKAKLPSAAGGDVTLTKVAKISLAAGQKVYALAFAPAGVLGAGEELVGGDGSGELWSIDTATGATKDLGDFGADPSVDGNVLALSGDIVFYDDAAGKPTGIATIRSCTSGKSPKCDKTNDYLAGIDMTALAAAFASGKPATSLLGGIYGGTSTTAGSGVGYGELFGLGAWEGSVYAFSRATSGATGSPPQLISIDPTTGAGSVVPGSFAFTNGWSGAGVTTKVTVTLPPPPAPPK